MLEEFWRKIWLCMATCLALVTWRHPPEGDESSWIHYAASPPPPPTHHIIFQSDPTELGVSSGWAGLDQYYKVVPGELTIVTGEQGRGRGS